MRTEEIQLRADNDMEPLFFEDLDDALLQRAELQEMFPSVEFEVERHVRTFTDDGDLIIHSIYLYEEMFV
jgi:hypothetical protein